MAYPTPADVNYTKGFSETANYLNNIVDQNLFLLIILGIYVIVITYNKDKLTGFAIGGFLTGILGVVFAIAKLLDARIFLVCIAISIISVVVSFIGKRYL